MIEIFKDIIGYNGSYQVSNLGNVISVSLPNQYSKIDRLLKFDESERGYRRVTLSKEGITERFLVHRLVACHFLPCIAGKPFVNHIDSNPSNNVVTNLEWCTPSENAIHAYKNGRLTKALNSATSSAIIPNHHRYAKMWEKRLGDRFLGFYPDNVLLRENRTKPAAAVRYTCILCNQTRLGLTNWFELSKHNGTCPNCIQKVKFLDEDIV